MNTLFDDFNDRRSIAQRFAAFDHAHPGLPIERAEDQDGGGAKESTVGTLLGLADGGAGDAGGGGQAILREPAMA